MFIRWYPADNMGVMDVHWSPPPPVGWNMLAFQLPLFCWLQISVSYFIRNAIVDAGDTTDLYICQTPGVPVANNKLLIEQVDYISCVTSL